MAKTKISEYSSTSAGANLNTDINTIDIDEGCAPSGINNAIRTLMAQLKDFQTGVSGDGLTLGGALSGTSATFSGNVTASAISGASLTLSGNITASAISGASLTLSGNVTASAISGASMTLSGDLTVDTNTLYVDSTNNEVGIGTSSPDAKLHIHGGDQTTANIDTSSNIVLNVAGTGASSNNGGSVVFSAADGAWKFAAIKGLVVDGANNTSGDLAFSVRNATTDSTLSEAMRIKSNGNVGIGASSPTVKFQVAGGDSILCPDGNVAGFGGTVANAIYKASGTEALVFRSNSSERMRIDSSGNVLIGTTTQASTARFTVKAANTGYGGIGVVQSGGSTYWTQNIDSLDGYTWGKNGSDFWYAGRSGSNNCVSTSGSWINSSDSRLKTNIKTISNALENVCNLRGVSYNRISNNSSEIGLIAQEVLEIYPDAVEKPSTDKDFYGLNYGALVAPLIEAIKEQQDIIKALETRIQTLENK